jgi:hypothetical protein
MEGSSGEADGQGVVGVQGEEPDAWPALCRHVGAEVDLRELRKTRDGGQESGLHAGHAERDDT